MYDIRSIASYLMKLMWRTSLQVSVPLCYPFPRKYKYILRQKCRINALIH